MATPSFGSGPAVAHQEAPADPESAAHAEIELRAYFIYLEEGGGDPHDHWRRAEREVARRTQEQRSAAEGPDEESRAA